MGANNSKKSAPKSRARPGKHKDPKPRQDVVRGQKIIIDSNDDNANRLSTHITDNHKAEEYVLKHYGNTQPAGPTTTVYTDIPQQNPQIPTSQAHHTENNSRIQPYSQESEGPIRTRLLSEQTLSSDEEYLDVPAIIRSTPETHGIHNTNINTIKQAKVNVKGRISFFKETNAPLIAVRDSKTRLAGGPRLSRSPPTETTGEHSERADRLPTTKKDNSRKEDEGRIQHQAQKKHIVTKSKQANAAKQDESQWSPRRTSEPAIVADHRLKTTTTQREVNSSFIAAEPEPDYSMEREKDWSNDDNRMNTLEYFKQVPREHALLRGFEKAKPAARIKKAKLNSPPQNHSSKPKPHGSGVSPEDKSVRPKSMFTTGPYSSTPDMYNDGKDQPRNSIDNPIYSDHQGLVSSTTGQRYASDDTEYETLTRKKKIAGQRLAVGVVDKQTERNFLKSLQRNAQFKHAKGIDTGSEDEGESPRRPQLEDMVF